jgi:hypothetical protein
MRNVVMGEGSELFKLPTSPDIASSRRARSRPTGPPLGRCCRLPCARREVRDTPNARRGRGAARNELWDRVNRNDPNNQLLFPI